MTENQILKIVKEYVQNNCHDDPAAHDWWHIHRVLELAKRLCAAEGSNPFIVEMIALLHDVYDHKFYPEADTGQMLKDFLEHLNVLQHLSPKDQENIFHSIANLSFKGGIRQETLSLEGQIARDADRLDSMGAIAIARTFAYGGKKDRALYDPEVGIVEVSPEEYTTTARHSINHFYEKLLKLKDLMNTPTGIAIAQQRHEYMEGFLAQFFAEWEGEK